MTLLPARRAAVPAALVLLALTTGLPAAHASPAQPVSAAGPPAGDAPWLKGKWGDDTTNETASASSWFSPWDPTKDRGSAWSTAKTVHAFDVWGASAPATGLKLTGRGVGVALIDTGITPVAGLDGVGKIVNGPDLSTESQVDSTRYLDGYGHGTHMAGLIAGRDTSLKAGEEKSGKGFAGMAPDATLVNVKVGAGDGGVDVSQVVAGIDWVVAHRAETNTRVLNLSYGTDSQQSPSVDPLAHAVENAWRAGIVVVVSAGNAGEDGATSLAMPAVDPYVLAVGSSDHRGSDKPELWRVGAWTNPGTAMRRPDLVAPGKSVVSLRVPGGLADTDHPEGRVATETAGRMFRGTGTSQSAAVVSGLAALLVQRDPSLTPDQVKGLLVRSAARLAGETAASQGAGLVDIKGAVELLDKKAAASPPQVFPRSTGLGSLQASRGNSALVDPIDGNVLSGERDLMGTTWNPAGWAAASSAGTAWSGGSWNGRAWTGDGWQTITATSTTGTTWAGRAWAGRAWAGASWSGRAWAGRAWAGGAWSGRAWAAGSWAGRAWAGRAWAGRAWAGLGWLPLVPSPTAPDSTGW